MAPPVPRPATTVLLVRDGDDGVEVLMVVRDAESYFASAMVFPGGIIDAEDADDAWLDLSLGGDGLDVHERARRVAGFRELWEETGVLLLDSPERLDSLSPETPFMDLVARSGGRLDLSAMAPFAHWITPETSPKRYDTHFRLCWATTEMTAVADGRETVSVEWLKPADALALGESKRRNLLFPTKCQLELLAEAASVEAAVAAAHARPIVPVTPMIQMRPEGTFLTIPADAGYGAKEFFAGPPRPAQ